MLALQGVDSRLEPAEPVDGSLRELVVAADLSGVELNPLAVACGVVAPDAASPVVVVHRVVVVKPDRVVALRLLLRDQLHLEVQDLGVADVKRDQNARRITVWVPGRRRFIALVQDSVAPALCRIVLDGFLRASAGLDGIAIVGNVR